MRLQLDSAIPRPADTGQSASIGSSGSSGGVRGQDNSGSNDSIQISGPSAALGRLSSQRAERIAQVSAALRSGTYQISGSAIGSAIIAQAISLKSST
jgi:anti-sigma28 factor (negative regulator of flagellin synthesis)